jgi:hypothetical protein
MRESRRAEIERHAPSATLGLVFATMDKDLPRFVSRVGNDLVHDEPQGAQLASQGRA